MTGIKGKAKSNTKKKSKKKEKETVESLQEFFYYFLLKEDCDVSLLAENVELPDDKKEIWVSYNCLELILPHHSLVLEDAREDFDREEDRKLLLSMNVKSVYGVTFMEEDRDTALSILKGLGTQFKGLLCSDTEDFKPYIIKEGWEIEA